MSKRRVKLEVVNILRKILLTYDKNNNIMRLSTYVINPFDLSAVKAINNGYTIVDIDCAAGYAVQDIYKKAIDILYD